MTSTLHYDPQKAVLVDVPPDGDGWVHEIKLDGFRMGLTIDGTSIRLTSRRGNDYTAEYPEVIQAARTLKVSSALVDGEVVVLDEGGVSRFERLQQLRFSRRGLTFFAFDLLAIDGTSLARAPLLARKARLEQLLADIDSPYIRYTPHFAARGADVFANACALGAEGIVSKRVDAAYRAGTRASDWQKTKCVKRQEFVVGGFTDPDGSRAGVGSILVGYHEGDALRFAGKVGTGRGWTASFSERLRRRLEKIERNESPFRPAPPGWLGRNAHWVKPEIVAEVSFAEWTTGGHVRHPTLLGFRDDKAPCDVVRERAENAAAGKAEGSAAAAGRRAPAATRRPMMLYPRLGLTSHDLAELYGDIGHVVLPHIINRPLTVVRAKRPISDAEALRTQAAFVHHTARDQAFIDPRVPRANIVEKKKVGEYCYIDTLAALVALVESGVTEWHAWNARVDDVERPDQIVLDLDPGEGVTWAAIVGAARALRHLLAKYDLACWVKTTGGRGLHVVVPFEREHDWDSVFQFSKAIAGVLAESDPSTYTLNFDRDARAGKLLIDYKRNYRTSIAVAPFSVRARADAAMSVPVSWQELARVGDSARWTAANIHARLRRQRSDPWADLHTVHQHLPSVVRTPGRVV